MVEGDEDLNPDVVMDVKVLEKDAAEGMEMMKVMVLWWGWCWFWK